MTTLYLDLETRSAVDIYSGLDRYIPACEIILVSWAEDDQPVQSAESVTPELIEAIMFAERVVIHNAPFDAKVLKEKNGINILPSQVHCTQARARMLNLPDSLANLCSMFKVPVELAKDDEGKALIKLFCIPGNNGKYADKNSHPEEWARFVRYGIKDIEAMRYLDKNIPMPFITEAEKKVYALDWEINQRGIPIDLEFVKAANKEVQDLDDRNRQVAANYEMDSMNQAKELLIILRDHHYCDIQDVTTSTLERLLADPDLPAETRELVNARLASSKASIKKYPRLLQVVSGDGRLRNACEYYGAPRSGRWAGRAFQPHNLPNIEDYITLSDLDAFRTILLSGAATMIYPDNGQENLPFMLSQGLRYSVCADEGKKLTGVDLKNIESRILAVIANEEWKIGAFARSDSGEGADVYAATYARAMGKHIDEVGPAERAVGKLMDLSCGFGGGPNGKLTRAMVDAWRDTHPRIKWFWEEVEDSFRQAVAGRDSRVGHFIKFRREKKAVVITLPDGSEMWYQNAVALSNGDLTYYGRKPGTKFYSTIKIHGGKIAENICQQIARNVLAHGMLNLKAAGFDIILTVHDEVIIEHDEDKDIREEAIRCMTQQLKWLRALPLAAETWTSRRWIKEK